MRKARKFLIFLVIVLVVIAVARACALDTPQANVPFEQPSIADGVLVSVKVSKQDSTLPVPIAPRPTQAYIADPRQATAREVALPQMPEGQVEFPWISRAGGFVYIGGIGTEPLMGGMAAFLTSDLSKRIELGPAKRIFPGAGDDQIWLAGKDGTLAEFDVAGHALTPLYRIPKGRDVVGIVAEGAALTRPSDIHVLDIWDPSTNNFVREIRGTGVVSVASAKYIEDVDRDDCSSHCPQYLRPVEGGESISFVPDEGNAWIARAISPDGTKYALLERPASISEGNSTTTAVVYELSSGKEIARHQIRSWTGRQSLQWSPTSSWVYFGQDATHVAMFRVSDPERSAQIFSMGAATGLMVSTK